MSIDDLDAVMARINSTYKMPLVGKGDDKVTQQLVKQWRMQLGIPQLDIALGGGYPLGRIEHVIGEYSSGKSAYAKKLTAVAQGMCRNCMKPLRKRNWQTMTVESVFCCKNPEPFRCAWGDAEKVFDPQWAQRNGVDVQSLLHFRAEYGEQFIDIVTELLGSGEIDFLVVDSIAAVVPSVELEESTEKQQMGTHAKMFNKALKKWVSKQHAASLRNPHRPAPSIVLLNQWRRKVGFVMGDPRTTPAGGGPGFFASIESHIKRVKRFKDTAGNVLAQQIEILYKKNKTGIPEGVASFVFALRDMPSQRQKAGGIDIAQQLLELSEMWGIVRKEAAMYQLAQGISVRGVDAAVEAILTKPGLYDMLLKSVYEKEKVIQDGGFLEPSGKQKKKKGKVEKKGARPSDDDDDDDDATEEDEVMDGATE